MMEKKNSTRCVFQAMALAILMSGVITDVFAQKGKSNLTHIGLIYPLSTNGKTAQLDTNDFSLHLIAGISRQENNFLIAGVAGIVKGDAKGTMISGVYNQVGGHAKGVQVAGLINRIQQDAEGAQIAGLINQSGRAQGIQIAGLMNRSGDATTQVAGLVNVAKRVSGVQVAGLINIAEQSDYPIGILNFIKEGEQQIGIAVDEEGSTTVALRSGGRVLYGIVGLGYNFKHEEARYVVEAGIGAHLVSAGAFRLNAEVASAAMTNFEDGVYGKQRLGVLAGFRITPGIELFAGPTLNHLLTESDQTDLRDGRYLWSWDGDDVHSGFFVGGMVGVQFSL